MNPCSGTKKANKYLTDIVNIFTVNDYVSTVLTTTKRGDGRIYAKNYAKKVDLIVCIGGDGTFNEVVSGVIQSGSNECRSHIFRREAPTILQTVFTCRKAL